MKEGTRVINFEELRAIAKEFARGLRPRAEGATVVALYGELGSGKTTFVQSAAHALGVEKTVISPTFVIERRYELKNQTFDTLIHIDAYRFEQAEELRAIGWNEKLKNNGNLIFVEWPDRVEEKLPENIIRIRFEFIDKNIRRITINSKIKNQSAKLRYSPTANEF